MCLLHLHLPPLLLIAWCKLHHLPPPLLPPPLLHLPPVRAVHPPRAPVSGGVVPAMCQPPAATGAPSLGVMLQPVKRHRPPLTPLFPPAFNTPDDWCARHTWLRVFKKCLSNWKCFLWVTYIKGIFWGKWMDGWMDGERLSSMSLMPRVTAADAPRELISIKWHDAS